MGEVYEAAAGRHGEKRSVVTTNVYSFLEEI
jgi:hypothetical protein